jgi:hypothetical protein
MNSIHTVRPLLDRNARQNNKYFLRHPPTYITSTNISQGFPIAILNDCLLPAMSLDWAATWVPLLWSEPFEEPFPFPVAMGSAERGPNDVRSLSEALLWPAAASFRWSEPFDDPPARFFPPLKN